MPVVRPTDRVFVGRVAEREALAAHIAEARQGKGRVVLVGGEPGIGKTRLVEEAVAGIASGRVLWGRCQEIQGAPAFWPWIQALRAYVSATPPGRLRAELGDVGPELARLVPGIRIGWPDVGTVGAETLDPETARFRPFDAVTMFLRAIAASDMVMIVLEDLHWADNESLLLLAFVARDLRDRRLLVLGTYREAELRHAAAGGRALGDLVAASHELTLGGLTPDDVGQYAAAMLGRLPTTETVEAIHRATEGNAFFVTEIVRLLHARGKLEDAAIRSGLLDLPAEIHEVIRRRIKPLSSTGRHVLAAAAVLGPEFEVDTLARVVGQPVDAILPELAAAVQLGAIAEVVERPGEFRFAHALLQETLTADLGAGARAELHRAAGAVLEAVHQNAV